jgi:hypothetical protein
MEVSMFNNSDEVFNKHLTVYGNTEHSKALIEIDLDAGFIKTATMSEVYLRATKRFPLIIEDDDIVKSPLCTNKAEMISEIAAWNIKELCEKPEEEIIFLYKELEKKYTDLLKILESEYADENQ